MDADLDADAPLLESRKSAVLRRVRQVRAGKQPDSICLEGERLIRDAHAAGVELDLLLWDAEGEGLALGAQQRFRVPGEWLQQVSGLRTSPGCLALAPTPRRFALDELACPADALLLVIDGVSDPGNLGALARSGEAAGAWALAATPGSARPFGEKALRGSMGSLLRLPVVEEREPAELLAVLTERGFRSVRADTRGGVAWDRFDWSGRIALWVCGETGSASLSAAQGFESVSIPMAGRVESLNVTVAASLLLFATRRYEGGAP